MRPWLLTFGSLLLACGPPEVTEFTPESWCAAAQCQLVDPAPDTLSWGKRELWFSTEPQVRSTHQQVTLSNHGLLPTKVEIEVQGPFRLTPQPAVVPAFGSVTLDVHFEGEGLGQVLGTLALREQGPESVVFLHGEGSRASP